MNPASPMNYLCSICKGLKRRNGAVAVSPWDVVIAETEHFAALPTRGAIVPGWILVVTKEHSLCMGEVARERYPQLMAFVNEVRTIVEDCFGPAVVFEHGPAEGKQQVGCGVDHAHVHIVPTPCNLLVELPAVFPEQVHWQQVDSLEETKRFTAQKKPYLFVEQPKGHCWAGTHPQLGSQLFRKVIAKSVRRPDEFDWKFFPEYANAKRTAEVIRAAFAAQSQHTFS